MLVQKAGTILLNLENKKIALVYRPKRKDFSFPKGHLELGETLQECAVRETEEETLRANHLYSDKEVEILKYITPAGEDTECHVYIAIDDGPTTKNIKEEEREEIKWVSPENVESTLSYTDLKQQWRKAKPSIIKIFSTKNV